MAWRALVVGRLRGERRGPALLGAEPAAAFQECADVDVQAEDQVRALDVELRREPRHARDGEWATAEPRECLAPARRREHPAEPGEADRDAGDGERPFVGGGKL